TLHIVLRQSNRTYHIHTSVLHSFSTTTRPPPTSTLFPYTTLFRSNFDWALLKNTKVKEDLTVQFRAEFFNVFNNVSFARFTNDLSSPSFGTYSGTDTTPRQIQFALKLLW